MRQLAAILALGHNIFSPPTAAGTPPRHRMIAQRAALILDDGGTLRRAIVRVEGCFGAPLSRSITIEDAVAVSPQIYRQLSRHQRSTLLKKRLASLEAALSKNPDFQKVPISRPFAWAMNNVCARLGIACTLHGAGKVSFKPRLP